MANISVTEAAAFIPEIWAATALGALKANTVMAQLVSRDYEDEIARAGDTVNVPKRGALTVNDKAEDGAVTLQNPAATTVQVVLTKHKEVSFLVEDVAKAQANQDIIEGYVKDGMIAIAHQIDTDLTALESDLTTHTAIDATTGLGDDDVREARRVLNSAMIPLVDRNIVLHEDAEKELLGIEKFTSADYGAEGSAVREASIGRRFGFNFFMDQKIKVDTAVCQNLAFHRDCFALVTRPLPPVPPDMGAKSVVMEEDGIAIRVIYSYNPTYLGVQVTLDVLYGVKTLDASRGVVILTTEA